MIASLDADRASPCIPGGDEGAIWCQIPPAIPTARLPKTRTSTASGSARIALLRNEPNQPDEARRSESVIVSAEDSLVITGLANGSKY